MALFLPVWVTQNRTLGTINDGDVVSVALEASEVMTSKGLIGQFNLVVGGYAGRVNGFRVNDIAKPFHTVGTEIQFEALTAPATLTTYAYPVLRFSIIAGALPPGLSLDPATGLISGTVAGSFGSEQVFEFTVRVANIFSYSDRTFNFVTPQLFIPVWVTPAGELPSYREGDTVSLALVAEELLETTIIQTQFFVDLGPNAGTVLRVLIDDEPVPFTVVGTQVRFPPLVQESANCKIYTAPTLTFLVNNGSLPPGLTLNATTGLISGVVGTVLGHQLYEFTIRLDNRGQVRDQTFTMQCNGLADTASINLTPLPPLESNDPLGLVYYPLGEVKRGEVFALQFDVFDPNGVSPDMSVRKVQGLPDTGEFFGTLPEGLGLSGYTLQGTVAPAAFAGTYYFVVRLSEGDTIMQEITCEITVLFDVEDVAATLPELAWVTPSGVLGVLSEGDLSTFRVLATVTGDRTVSYHLAPHSGTLPYGLRLDETTGLIFGQAQHVSLDKDSTFIVRASSDGVFEDRSFTITVRSLYSSDHIIRVFLRAYESESEPLMRPYGRVINSAAVYRPEDDHFGIKTRAEVYLIGGLDADKDFAAAISGEGLPAIGPTDDYHGSLKLVLGGHYVAVARDSNGDVAYEVLYRLLYDPQTGAGGFMQNNVEPVDEPVLYPQTLDPHYVFPVSLRNIRYDLAHDIGFPARNAALADVLGPTGVEAMPLWMRSQQTEGDATTVPGYVPAITIAFLKPGTGKAVLQSMIKNAASLETSGKVMHFDKYYTISDIIVNLSSFDEDLTVFDINTTFDGDTNLDTKYSGF